jgi:aryl sulfotransferase
MPEQNARFIWKDGLGTFFFKGTNGRWRDVLTADELAMYERARTRCLTPDCAAYLEGGRAVLDSRAA